METKELMAADPNIEELPPNAAEEDAMRVHAAAAGSAYTRQKKHRQKWMDDNGFGSYKIHHGLSGKEYSVFTDDAAKHAIFAVRGTDIGNKQGGRVGDLLTDAALIGGLETITPRWKRADKGFQRMMKELGDDYRYTVTGHSLGGKIAQGLAWKHHDKVDAVHAFAPGATHVHARKGMERFAVQNKKTREHRAKSKTYHVLGDYISNSSLLDQGATENILIKKRNKKTKAHAIENFL